VYRRAPGKGDLSALGTKPKSGGEMRPFSRMRRNFWWGEGRYAQIVENLDDDRRIFNACPEPAEEAANIKGPPHCGEVVWATEKTRVRN